MNQVISKWTSMLTDVTSGGLTLMASAAIVAIIVFVIIGIFSGEDARRAGTVKSIVIVLIFCAVAALGSSLVQWAVS